MHLLVSGKNYSGELVALLTQQTIGLCCTCLCLATRAETSPVNITLVCTFDSSKVCVPMGHCNDNAQRSEHMNPAMSLLCWFICRKQS